MLAKYFSAICAVAFLLGLETSNAAVVTPIVNDYGNVFPTLTNLSLDSFRSNDPAPWYVSFNLVAQADVKVGAIAEPGGAFVLNSMRLVTLDGGNVAFGTNTFTGNPFSDDITQLAIANNLPIGHYAIEISGTGNRILSSQPFQDATDFITRLQVTTVNAVPEPETYAMMVVGLVLASYAMRKLRQRVS